jgi:hypothetical protein
MTQGISVTAASEIGRVGQRVVDGGGGTNGG